MMQQRERGFALLVTLWCCALLAMLASSAIVAGTGAVHVAHNAASAARARAQADAGVTLGILGALGVAADGAWPQDGTARSLRVADGVVRVSIQDELGLLDVNAAAPETLARLFAQLGAPAHEADRAAAAIARARLHAPIAEPGALATLGGMPAGIAARASPYLTVRTQTAAVDPATAPALVLNCLPGLSPGAVRLIAEARAATAALPGTLPLLNDATPGGGQDRRFAVIRARAETADGAHFTRVSEIELTPALSPPFRVLSWRGPDRAD
jgi:general secretion pathway protein K